MIERYSRKEIRNIWTDKNKYKIWLDIELASAEAMEKLNIIPKGVVKKIKSRAKIDVEVPLEIGAETDNQCFVVQLKNGFVNTTTSSKK